MLSPLLPVSVCEDDDDDEDEEDAAGALTLHSTCRPTSGEVLAR